jgi:hypothetical protein
VFAHRKEYDILRNKVNSKGRQLDDMNKKVKAAANSKDSASVTRKQQAERLKGLEMKLNTVTLKITG